MSDRSASPAREEPKPKKQKTGGFKWKEKKPREDDTSANARDSGHLQRGYRDRSPRRDSYRERERDRDRDREPRRDRNDDRYRDREPRRETDSYNPRNREQDADREDAKAADISSKFAGYKSKPSHNPPNPAEPSNDSNSNIPSTEPRKERKKDKKPKPSTSSEPMILVTVNDRLGTKAQIPCLPSDNIKAFKALVAAQIGRQPHEILLKRQGERPFKDALTLEDYGVGNGVQLDLELDTGD